MDKKYKNFGCTLLLFLFFFSAAILFGRGNKDTPASDETGTVIQVTGRVRLVGSDPLPELVISGSEQQWYIARDEIPKLHELQQRTVTVEALETIIMLNFASGLPAGERRTLSNITVLEVE